MLIDVKNTKKGLVNMLVVLKISNNNITLTYDTL